MMFSLYTRQVWGPFGTGDLHRSGYKYNCKIYIKVYLRGVYDNYMKLQYDIHRFSIN